MPTLKKAYCFTLNNYTDEERERIFSICETEGRYAIVGEEIGEQGTRHLQGYVIFKKSYRFTTIKNRYLPRCHIEVAAGDARSNQRYCSKDGVFREFGEIPKSTTNQSRDKLAERFRDCMVEGRHGVTRFADENPGTWYFSGHNLFRNFWALQRPVERPNISVRWFCGPPGVGKSRKAHEEIQDGYIKEPRTKWWNGYCGEREVIIDDFGPNGIDINHLLRWFDRYKCYIETKGGMLPLLADKFIVTSNFAPSEIFVDQHGVLHQQLPALERRIVIEYFTN